MTAGALAARAASSVAGAASTVVVVDMRAVAVRARFAGKRSNERSIMRWWSRKQEQPGLAKRGQAQRLSLLGQQRDGAIRNAPVSQICQHERQAEVNCRQGGADSPQIISSGSCLSEATKSTARAKSCVDETRVARRWCDEKAVGQTRRRVAGESSAELTTKGARREKQRWVGRRKQETKRGPARAQAARRVRTRRLRIGGAATLVPSAAFLLRTACSARVLLVPGLPV